VEQGGWAITEAEEQDDRRAVQRMQDLADTAVDDVQGLQDEFREHLGDVLEVLVKSESR